MKEIAEAEENEATKRKKQGGSSRQREKASQEMESVFTTEDHDGDYDDFVSFNFDNYQSFISYFKLTKLINIFLFRLITWIMISIIVNEEICVGKPSAGTGQCPRKISMSWTCPVQVSRPNIPLYSIII